MDFQVHTQRHAAVSTLPPKGAASEFAFNPFPRLAAEIRRKIWGYALPGKRIIKISTTLADKEYILALNSGSKLNEDYMVSSAEDMPLLRACFESRAVALETYSLRFSSRLPHPIYYNPAKDFLLMANARAFRVFTSQITELEFDGEPAEVVAAVAVDFSKTRRSFFDPQIQLKSLFYYHYWEERIAREITLAVCWMDHLDLQEVMIVAAKNMVEHVCAIVENGLHRWRRRPERLYLHATKTISAYMKKLRERSGRKLKAMCFRRSPKSPVSRSKILRTSMPGYRATANRYLAVIGG